MTSHQSTIRIMYGLSADQPIIPIRAVVVAFPRVEIRELSPGPIAGNDITFHLIVLKIFW